MDRLIDFDDNPSSSSPSQQQLPAQSASPWKALEPSSSSQTANASAASTTSGHIEQPSLLARIERLEAQESIRKQDEVALRAELQQTKDRLSDAESEIYILKHRKNNQANKPHKAKGEDYERDSAKQWRDKAPQAERHASEATSAPSASNAHTQVAIADDAPLAANPTSTQRQRQLLAREESALTGVERLNTAQKVDRALEFVDGMQRNDLEMYRRGTGQQRMIGQQQDQISQLVHTNSHNVQPRLDNLESAVAEERERRAAEARREEARQSVGRGSPASRAHRGSGSYRSRGARNSLGNGRGEMVTLREHLEHEKVGGGRGASRGSTGHRTRPNFQSGGWDAGSGADAG